ncbi:MAG: gas vesicle protein K [Candidatus Omnitrophota bacterium]
MTMNRTIETNSQDAFIEEIEKVQDVLPKRIDANPKNVEKGLAKLVLTLVELIRKLLEKQAMRRIEGGSLSEEEIEGIGETLMKLENKMKELKEIFGLKDEELNLNLGPLGDLM